MRRQILFQRLAEGVQQVRQLWEATAPCMTGAGMAAPVKVCGFITPDTQVVVSEVAQDDCGLLSGPYTADCSP